MFVNDQEVETLLLLLKNSQLASEPKKNRGCFLGLIAQKLGIQSL